MVQHFKIINAPALASQSNPP